MPFAKKHHPLGISHMLDYNTRHQQSNPQQDHFILFRSSLPKSRITPLGHIPVVSMHKKRKGAKK